jgi:hypothetical protein
LNGIRQLLEHVQPLGNTGAATSVGADRPLTPPIALSAAKFGCLRFVDRERIAGDRNPVGGPRVTGRHLLLEHIVQHGHRIAQKRITMAAPAGEAHA